MRDSRRKSWEEKIRGKENRSFEGGGRGREKGERKSGKETKTRRGKKKSRSLGWLRC